VYPQTTVDIALRLSSAGVLDRENGRICGVSAAAIRHWRSGRRRNPENQHRQPSCPLCDGAALNQSAYAYLLGLYLGDGSISRGRRDVYALSIACADAWPGLIGAAKIALSEVMPASKVFCVQRPGCTEVKSTSRHWPCLFPQHGPGRKHTREIRIQQWQAAIVTDYPGDFIRGLMHSDGCRGINRIRRKISDGERVYEYPRYFFSNKSKDILELCCSTLDQLGVSWRFCRPDLISVARREAVARLDEFVGPKY